MMKSRGRASALLKPPPHPPSVPSGINHYDKRKKMMEMRGGDKQPATIAVNRRRENRARRMELLDDVDKLKRKLRLEKNVHRALERAFTRPLGVLPRLPPYLPPQTLELLAEVAVLEEEVVRLEEQVAIFSQKVALRNADSSSVASNDVISIKSDRLSSCSMAQPALARTSSIKKMLESDKPSESPYSLTNVKQDTKKMKLSSTNKAYKSGKENHLTTSADDRLSPNAKQPKTPTKLQFTEKEPSHFKRQVDYRSESHGVAQQSSSSSSSSEEKPSHFESTANRVSEEVLSCLSAIFIRLNASKRNSFLQRTVDSHPRLCTIEAASLNLSRSSNAKFLIQQLKILLGKLEMVKIQSLTHQQKLAFWINVYNSCMMNAFLEHGVPESSDMVADLMQKASINVGGNKLNAIAIEHFILRLPYHSKYTCPKVAQSDEVKAYSEFALEWSEPLITFALSSGNRSSPAVRVYTAAGVEKELEVAKRDYLKGAIGISETNKLKIPKLLTWYLLDFAKDLESLVDWICLELPDDLRKAAMECMKSRRQEPISEYLQITPYDFSFCFLLNI